MVNLLYCSVNLRKTSLSIIQRFRKDGQYYKLKNFPLTVENDKGHLSTSARACIQLFGAWWLNTQDVWVEVFVLLTGGTHDMLDRW